MADTKSTDLYYNNLGGINIKASDYSTGAAQFLALYNLDFDVPNALQKRPGSTQAVSAGTSGPINSLFEFIRLEGQSYVIAASDTALFYLASNQYTLLSSGWNNGQPPDMLTFVDRLWVANGQKYQSWDAATYGVLPAGLPVSGTSLFLTRSQNANATLFTVGGATSLVDQTGAGAPWTSRSVFLAYSYLRDDGYVGPINFLASAQNLITHNILSGTEYFDNGGADFPLNGFTIPSGYGISSIQLWVGVDTVRDNSALIGISGIAGPVRAGDLGYQQQFAKVPSLRLKPGANLGRFHLYTTIPGGSLFADSSSLGTTMWSIFFTFNSTQSSFAQYDSVATSDGFSGMQFAFFTSYAPKFIELNQNIMFMAGFSQLPSDVWFSEVGAPETVLPDSNFEVRTNDGDKVMALCEFQNQLMVFKETSFHKLLGNSADNFELVQVSSEYGCISNRCVIPYANNIAFLDRKGIVIYNGASWSIRSNAVESVFRRMNLSAAREFATAVNHIYRNQIWFGIPVDGSTQNNLTVVYDYLADAWTYFDGYNAASFAYVKGQLNVPTAWRGDYSGLIHYTGASFYSDSGRAISCVAFTRFENFGGQNETSIWRRFFLDVATATGLTGQINGQVMSNYDHSTVQATFTIYQNQFQSRAEMGVVGKGVAAMLSHSSASLPLLINGYAWGKRPLRNV